MNKTKTIITVLILLGLALLLGYYYVNRPVASLENARPDFILSADELYSAFDQNEAAATKKYVEKVIEVHGAVQSADLKNPGDRSISLKTSSGMYGVICKLDSSYNSHFEIKEGDSIKIKGICNGMLMDIVLNRCIPLSK